MSNNMSDVELVIKIPEEIMEYIKNNGCLSVIYNSEIASAIANGTPLPKGHGRLIDADELKTVYDERITYLYALNKKDNPSRETRICATNWCANTIKEAPTIVETDYAGLEEKLLGEPNAPDPVYTTGIYDDDYDKPEAVSTTDVDDIQF